MKLILKILGSLISLALLILLVIKIYFGPWLVHKIKTEYKTVTKNYIIEIDRINLKIIHSALEFKGISIYPSLQGNKNLKGEIRSVRFSGINLLKAVLKNEFLINDITVSDASFSFKAPIQIDAKPVVSPVRIDIGNLSVKGVGLEIQIDSAGNNISLKDLSIKKDGVHLAKLDTLNSDIYRSADFRVGEITMNSPDNLYSFTAKGVKSRPSLNTLAVDSILINPVLKDYDFTSRFKFRKIRIEAVASGIFFNDLRVDSYFTPRVFKSSYIRIAEFNTKVFQDKRKEFRHSKKPTLKEMLSDLPVTLRIDSIKIAKGKIAYKVHAEEAKEPGMILFNDINVTLYNITNDTFRNKKNDFLEIKADALLMGKGKFSVVMKGKISGKNDAFFLRGTLSDLNVKDLNPILGNNAFIYASGKINSLNFSFIADKIMAKGTMTMLYDGLNVKIKDARVDDTTSFRARIVSFFANRRIIDSNQAKGEGVRTGTINYKRDPERYLLHYYFRSILTGIGSSITRNEKTSRKLKDI